MIYQDSIEKLTDHGRRPLIIVVLCLYLVVNQALRIVAWLSSFSRDNVQGDINLLYKIGTPLGLLLSIFLIIALWRMKKWAAWFYIALYAIIILTALHRGYRGTWSLWILGYILVVIAIGISYKKFK